MPLVVAPSELGVKMSRSSASDETPGTLAEPSVDSTIFPFESSSKASTSSPDVVRPTSEPSKYTLNAPLVVAPSDVASKRMTSESSIVPATPGRVAPSESREKSRECRIKPAKRVDASTAEANVAAVERETEG